MSEEAYFVGIDVGTSYIKVVIINEKNDVICSKIERSGPNLQTSISSTFDNPLSTVNIARSDIKHITSTGFGRRNVPFADTSKTEISCHAKGAFYHFPRKITVIDIGGQDTKIIKIDKEGKRIGFKMNRKCAAGTGTFLEEIAHKLDVRMDKMNSLAKKSKRDVALGSFCTVFASTEILTRIREGEKVEDMVRSAYESVVKRVIEMDSLDDEIVMTGGVIAYNDIILTILKKSTGNEILVPPEPQLIGAFGAALFAKEANLKS
jgi:predicted CoA-substrate-specific enzyme activase